MTGCDVDYRVAAAPRLPAPPPAAVAWAAPGDEDDDPRRRRRLRAGDGPRPVRRRARPGRARARRRATSTTTERTTTHDELDEHEERTVRPAQAWAGVVAQWLAGAVAGAVLWVLFRYLWRGLPVVALAAALLVTAGLVLLVRQLLHDRRTGAPPGSPSWSGCCSPRRLRCWYYWGDESARRAVHRVGVSRRRCLPAFALARELGYDGVELMVWSEPAQPGRGGGRPARRRVRCPGARGARAVPRGHAAGVDRGPRRAPAPRGRRGPRASARGRSSCTRRSAGSGATRRCSTTRCAGPRSTRASRWPWRTCSRWPAAACGPCPTARASTPPSSGYRNYTLDLSHTAAAGVDALALMDRMGDRARARPPRRRQRRPARRAPRARAAAASRARRSASCSRRRGSPARSSWRSAPGAPARRADRDGAPGRGAAVRAAAPARPGAAHADPRLSAPAGGVPGDRGGVRRAAVGCTAARAGVEFGFAAGTAATPTAREPCAEAGYGASHDADRGARGGQDRRGAAGGAARGGAAGGRPGVHRAASGTGPRARRRGYGVAAVDVADGGRARDVLVVAVKPQDIDPLLAELAPAIRAGHAGRLAVRGPARRRSTSRCCPPARRWCGSCRTRRCWSARR